MLPSFSDQVFYVFPGQSVALTVFIMALVAALGLTVGSFKFRGLSLGIPGVMFAGLVVGKLLGPGKLRPEVIDFMRDFGLILFVYAIGVQVGPGFIASLRRRGLPLNLMAMGIVLLGAATTIVIAAWQGMDMRAAIGLFTGATTNAPALGSAEEALKTVHPEIDGGTISGWRRPANIPVRRLPSPIPLGSWASSWRWCSCA